MSRRKTTEHGREIAENIMGRIARNILGNPENLRAEETAAAVAGLTGEYFAGLAPASSTASRVGSGRSGESAQRRIDEGQRRHDQRQNRINRTVSMHGSGLFGHGTESSENITQHNYEAGENEEPEEEQGKFGHKQQNRTMKDDIVEGIQQALGLHEGPPYYMPNKITRDYNRLASLNRIPPTKVWSKEELEHFNRKGIVEYKLIDVKNKNPLLVFNPERPNLVIERRAGTTKRNTVGMTASSQKQYHPAPHPHNYLVSSY